jgi:anti-sigma B factor antagonist
MASVNGGSQAEISVAESGGDTDTDTDAGDGGDGAAGVLTVSISGELDIVSVDALEDVVATLVRRPATTKVDLDLTDLAFMDSSGLAVLLRLANQFGPLHIRGARPLIRRVIEVTGLTGILLLEDEGGAQ